jgi:peptide/nickel transport system substrate-binding protein
LNDRTEPRDLTRRQVVKAAGAGALAVGGARWLAGCGPAGSSPAATATSAPGTGGPPAGGTPVKGGTLTVGWITGGQSETLNPGAVVSNGDIYRAQQLFDGLYQLGPDGSPQAWLAESAEPNADGTVWTVRLRDGVTWHDGKPFTADDVLASIRLWTNPNLNTGAPINSAFIKTAQARARNKRTVEIPMLRPLADLPSFLSLSSSMVMRADSFAKGKAIGTGPFTLESFTPGTQCVLAANASYWGGAPYVDKQVVNSSFSAETARVNALLSGQIDIAPGMPYALARTYAASKQLYIGDAKGPVSMYIACRVDEAPFTDPKVRRALKLLVNGPQMVESVFSGYGTPSNQVPMKGLPYWADLAWPGYDPEQAKSLLKQAGHENLVQTLYTSQVTAGFTDLATLYKQQALAGGVTINPKVVDPSVYYTSSGPAGGYLSYPMFVSVPGGGSSVPSLSVWYLSVGWSGAPFNEQHLGKEFDALLFDAIGELDKEKAEQKWAAYQKFYVDNSGQIIVANSDYVDGYGTNVRGVETGTGGWVGNFEVRGAWLTAA